MLLWALLAPKVSRHPEHIMFALLLAPLTVCEVRPLGEAELVAVLGLAGIHRLGVSVTTRQKKQGES